MRLFLATAKLKKGLTKAKPTIFGKKLKFSDCNPMHGVKSPSFVIGGTASVRCGLHSDNWRSVEPNSAWSLKSELKVQVLRVFQTRRGAPLKFLVSGVFRACVSV